MTIDQIKTSKSVLTLSGELLTVTISRKGSVFLHNKKLMYFYDSKMPAFVLVDGDPFGPDLLLTDIFATSVDQTKFALVT